MLRPGAGAGWRWNVPLGFRGGCVGSSVSPRERPLLTLQRRLGGGKASRLCPGSSDVDLFGYGESVVDLNAEVAHRALDLLVSQQKLYCPQIARAAVDECRLCSAQ